MRPEDVAEVYANSGLSPLVALTISFANSAQCYTIVNDRDEVCGMYGVVNDTLEPIKVGLVWMLASPKLFEGKRQFIKECRTYIDKLQEDYDLLYNYVDERNTVHIRWIEWSGFKIIKRHPEHGVQQIPFLEFVRINPSV
jgi:hypothetical protein